ncbi:hypothetical protein [Dokdonella sp.]|uniref:hypothetical protein n=1 Tax=Dokdonella sp. TaxID=2291710 RepID=UPI002F3EAC49
MDAFSYLSVLLSIILGLAITQVLKGFRGLMQSRARLRMYWPTVVWAILVLVIAVQSWWAMFDLRDHRDWTFLAFSIVLAQTIVVYLLAALVLPDFFGETGFDLRAHYYDHHRWFFALLVALIGVSIVKGRFVYGEWPLPLDLAYHLVFATTGVVCAYTRHARFHEVMTVVGVVSIGSYIAILFTHLT